MAEPGNFTPFTLELPFPADADAASAGVLMSIMGILRRGYPGDGNQRVRPAAMEQYAGQLATTMDRIYQDMLRTEREFTVRVTWDDSGVPHVAVVDRRPRKLIITPGAKARRAIIHP